MNEIDTWTTMLQYHSATLVDNKSTTVMASAGQRSGKDYKCLRERWTGKMGLMRGNLMAKRVNYSARSVITADPNLSIRQLGVPLRIATNLTKPVCVNSYNKLFLTKLLQNGPDVWPGARILMKGNGDCLTLRYVDRARLQLENGDILHRHMMDGDPVLFNRQPTLHRMSMMGHRVKVLKDHTFRINQGVTKPYNADFDGDEMNLHMPQNLESEAELKYLAAVEYQLISPANNTPIIGIYQDSMLGSYLFSRANVYFTPKVAMNLLMKYPLLQLHKLFPMFNI
jgi:DNA-directed RNA polymerase II subunit RPB1